MPVNKSKRVYSWANALSEQNRGIDRSSHLSATGFSVGKSYMPRNSSPTCFRSLRPGHFGTECQAANTTQMLHLMECSLEQLCNSQPPGEWEKDNFINHINHETSNVGDLFNVVHDVNVENFKINSRTKGAYGKTFHSGRALGPTNGCWR